MPPVTDPAAADLVYSLSLGGASAAAVAAWLLWALAHRAALRRWSRRAAALALVLVLLSFSVHLVFGHPAASDRALAPLGFLAGHPAMFLVAVAALLGRWVTRLERPPRLGASDPADSGDG